MNRSTEVILEANSQRKEGAYKHMRPNEKAETLKKNEVERSR